jgi:hypothetical protein
MRCQRFFYFFDTVVCPLWKNDEATSVLEKASHSFERRYVFHRPLL